MKRTILAVILIVCAAFAVYGQNTSPIDLVLLLDTSASMSSSYENVTNYVTGSFLSEFLRVGDTFHLIAFSGTPRLDVARRIADRGDVETIIGRMMLQYPVENGSNIGAAIIFAERYIASLPARPKKIILVSTGGSDASGLISAARQRLGLNNTIDFIQVTPGQAIANPPASGRSGQRTIYPGSSAPPTIPPSTAVPSTVTPAGTAAGSQTQTPGTTAVSPNTPAATRPGATAVTPDTTTSRPGTSTAAQDTTTSRPGTAASTDTTTGSGATSTPGTGTQNPQTTGTVSPSGTEQQRQSSTGATGTETREQSQQSGSQTAGDTDTPSARETASLPVPIKPRGETTESPVYSMPLIIGVIVLALLVLGLIIFFSSRKLGSSPNRAMAQAASSPSPKTVLKDDMVPFVDHSKELSSYAASQNRQRTTPYTNRPVKVDNSKSPAVINPSGPLLLNLFVEDQNTAIGKRNIHSLKSGYSLSVGGGNSDFLIFLVPIPPHIGEIRRNGSQCTFIPRKPKYFPDLGSNELRDCINKTIRIVSDKNYEMRFRFEMYEDPLEALNRILMSVSVPG
jgi:hypothetical protein